MIRGRYRLEELIGRGGMASVYRAHDQSLGRDVAVKLFRADSTDADELRRQSGEIELLASLNHHGLVTLFDAGVEGEDPPRPFLVMELVEGDDLRKRLEAGPLPPAFTASIGADLAEALHHIHLSGIIHRDVKPANVLVVPSDLPGGAPHAKLTDFGIAMLVDGARMTTAGSVLGTASYLSPEQALGRDLTPASDVYSLGLVLLECLSGQRAFPGTGVEAAVARIHRPPAIPTGLPAGWAALLTEMTRRDARARPSSTDVAGRLHELLRGGDAGTLHPTDDLDATVGMAMPAPVPAPAPVHEDHPDRGADAYSDVDLDADLDADDEYMTQVIGTRSEPVPAASVPGTPAFSFSDASTPRATPSVEDTGFPWGGQEPAEPDATTGEHPLRRRRTLAAVAAAVVVAVAGGILIFSITRGTDTTPPPNYPAVPGQLGDHLKQLQESVSQ